MGVGDIPLYAIYVFDIVRAAKLEHRKKPSTTMIHLQNISSQKCDVIFIQRLSNYAFFRIRHAVGQRY